MAYDPYAAKKYVVISTSLSSGSAMFQTRRTVTGKHINEVLTKLVELEPPRADETFSLHIERVPEAEE